MWPGSRQRMWLPADFLPFSDFCADAAGPRQRQNDASSRAEKLSLSVGRIKLFLPETSLARTRETAFWSAHRTTPPICARRATLCKSSAAQHLMEHLQALKWYQAASQGFCPLPRRINNIQASFRSKTASRLRSSARLPKFSRNLPCFPDTYRFLPV